MGGRLGVMLLCLLASSLVSAGEVDRRFDKPQCYTWKGGFGSQGSHTQCEPLLLVAAVQPVKETVIVEKVNVPAAAEVKQKPKKKVRD